MVECFRQQDRGIYRPIAEGPYTPNGHTSVSPYKLLYYCNNELQATDRFSVYCCCKGNFC